MVTRSGTPFSQDNLNEITLIKHSLNHNKTKIASRESIGYSKKKFNHRLNKYSIIWRDHISISIQSPSVPMIPQNDAHWSDPNLSDLHPEDNIETEFDDSGISEEFKQVINYMKYVKNCGLSVRMTEVVNWLIKRKEISDLNTTEDDDIDLDLLMNMGDPTETAT